MVAAFDHCLFGKGGAAPSIDTAMHGLVESPHVDHLHPDSGIAFATAADGEALTRACFGDRVAWVPWRRPGFQLGLDMAAVQRDNPGAIGAVLGGHGITAWGETSEACEANSLEIIRTAERYIAEHGRPAPFGPAIAGFEALPVEERRERAAALLPVIRGLASTDRPQVGHYTDSDVVLDFLASEAHPRLAALGTSCPDHFLRTKVRPMVLDLPPTAPIEEAVVRLRELHEAYRADYAAYYGRHATPDSPAMRGADPAIVLVPGVGMFSFGANKQTARVAGESTSTRSTSCVAPRRCPRTPRSPSRRSSGSSTGRSRRRSSSGCRSRSRSSRGSPSSPAADIPDRARDRGPARGRGRLRRRRGHRGGHRRGRGRRDRQRGCRARRALRRDRPGPVAAAMRDAVLAFGGVDIVVNNAGLSISKSLFDTTVDDWDLQHDVMARGSFLVSREGARVMRDQAMGGDLVYIVRENAFFAGPNNVAYGATKADQAHQVRLLAAELGQFGIRVNGINPDGVVRGSGIFAKGWGADRAKTYGIEEDKLGEFYAQRTLLKKEVLPEHVAAAVFALVGGDLAQTTGLHIPVDAGVAAAFLR